MESSERQSFVMYASFLAAAENLKPDQFKECILKMRDFAIYGEDVTSSDPMTNIILTMAKPNLNAAAIRYQQSVENGMKGKEHGAKGGRPRKGESRNDYLARKQAEKTPMKPLNDDADEKEKEKDKDDFNNDVEYIQSPASPQSPEAISPPSVSNSCRSSSNVIGLSSLGVEDSLAFKSMREAFIVQSVRRMAPSELANTYEKDIDKIALARATTGKKIRNEEDFAFEAALAVLRYDKLPTFADAKKAVCKDVAAAIQQFKNNPPSPKLEILPPPGDDEEEQPF